MVNLPVRRSAIERADPLSLIDDFSDYMNRMMGPFSSMDVGEQAWTPLVDMSENDEEYHVDIEAPGVRREGITIDIEGQNLSVTGQYRREDHTENHMRRSTRRSGQFEYSLRLPHGVDSDKAEAVLQNGVLCMIIPKTSSPGHKKIEIK